MVAYTKHDLQFILDGIEISQDHASQTNTVSGNAWIVSDLETSRQILLSLIPNSLEGIGMRTITGELNNLVIGQEDFGGLGEFPRLLDPDYRDDGATGDGTGNPADDAGLEFGPPGTGAPVLTNTDYGQSSGPGFPEIPGPFANGDVVDSDPRIISNLLVDQTVNNPVALNAALNLAGVEDVAQGLMDIPQAFADFEAALAAVQPLLDAQEMAQDDLAAALTAEATAALANDGPQATLAAYNTAVSDAAAAAALSDAASTAFALRVELEDGAVIGAGPELVADAEDAAALTAAIDAALAAITAVDDLVATLSSDPGVDPADLARAQLLATDVNAAANNLLLIDVADLDADAGDIGVAIATAADASANFAELAGSLADPADGLTDQIEVSQAAAQVAADATAMTLADATAAVTAAQAALTAADAAVAGAQGAIATAEDDLNAVLDSYGIEASTDGLLTIPNTAPDEGLSAPFNSWMTLFGQFFDHGLDLVQKGGSGTVYIPLQPDDPLYEEGSPTNFMVLTRATVDPGADGIIGTADDIADAQNFTSPFIDQNQTYTSHPSHQLFVREYEAGTNGPLATGLLIEGSGGGMATWGEVKAQAANVLGIELTDAEALNIPLFAVDQYGEFIPGASGLPQMVIELTDGGGNITTTLVEGNLANPLSVAEAIDLAEAANPGMSAAASLTGFAFLLDIAHNAAPVFDAAGNLVPDGDTDVGNAVATGLRGENLEYDNELLDAHFIAGDGRANENIGLTAVHHVFHQEHNRLVEHTKLVLLGSENNTDLGIGRPQWQPGSA